MFYLFFLISDILSGFLKIIFQSINLSSSKYSLLFNFVHCVLFLWYFSFLKISSFHFQMCLFFFIISYYNSLNYFLSLIREHLKHAHLKVFLSGWKRTKYLSDLFYKYFLYFPTVGDVSLKPLHGCFCWDYFEFTTSGPVIY